MKIARPKRSDYSEDGFRYFNEGVIVFMGKNDKLGYMSKNNAIIVKPIFNKARDVENGEAYVEIRNKAGVIKLQ